MQLSKCIEKFSEISICATNDQILLSSFDRVLKSFRLNGINRMLNAVKCSGLSNTSIFQTLFVLPFLNLKNIHRLFQSGISGQVIGDDNAYYRFMKDPKIPWRKILTSFTIQYTKAVHRVSVDEVDSSMPQCLICDDSILEKRGHKIETIGKVFDHCTHNYILGIKLLVLGLWDGKSFVPLDFSLHNEPGKNKTRGLKSKKLKEQYSIDRPHSSPGQQRINEVSESKILIVLQMINRAVRNGFTFKYVLADSWFISENFIKNIRSISRKGMESPHVIGLMKTNRFVSVNGKNNKLNTIPELRRSSIKRCKKLNCQYIPLKANYKGVEMIIFLVRMQGQQNWKALINTNKKCSFIESMKIYKIRWSIEVFFKDSKQYLNLGKSQSTNFDAQIASISLTLMNYIALTLVKRVDDYESIGYIFMHQKDMILRFYAHLNGKSCSRP